MADRYTKEEALRLGLCTRCAAFYGQKSRAKKDSCHARTSDSDDMCPRKWGVRDNPHSDKRAAPSEAR